ncbi:MAG: hypothetical protein VYB45_13595 [Pseudomonadota bacterium]|jgi:hypothetical protein|nr:hypothetical protein [Pseudomonadota bacterium]
MSKTNVRIALTSNGMAVFLIAAAAADIVRNQDIFVTGFSVNADIASTVSDWTPTRVQ